VGGKDMRIARIGTPQTFEKYEEDIKRLAKYHIRKSRTKDKIEDIVETFKQCFNRPDKLNGVVIDDDGKTIGFFMSRLDVDFFANISANVRLPVIFIEHMYCPETKGNNHICAVYKGIRDKFRKEWGAKDLFIFTHRNPEAWIKFSEGYDVHFDVYGYILVDRIQED
jgi:hypothetical protein